MHVLHEGEEPELRVASRVFEAFEGGCAGLAADGVAFDAVVGELAFLWGEPPCLQRVVGECINSTDCDNECGDALRSFVRS